MDNEVKIMTTRTGYQNKTLADTLILKPGEEFKIGDCINCSTIDDNELDYEQMTLDLGSAILEFESKGDSVKYINDWGGPQDCVVKVIK